MMLVKDPGVASTSGEYLYSFSDATGTIIKLSLSQVLLKLSMGTAKAFKNKIYVFVQLYSFA